VKLHILLLLPAALALVLAGCSGTTTPGEKGKDAGRAASGKPAADDEAEIKANLAKLSAEDRKLAEVQRWCAVQTGHRLGTMGTPEKVEVKGQPVFLCCESCRKKALADPDKTLSQVKALKEKAASSP
jgi:hypothetical protein